MPLPFPKARLRAQNYTFSFVNGVLTVQQAGSTVTLTSVYSTLSPTQSTGLTAIVTIAGGGGAPTGSVNFMLGTSLLGTGVLTATDGTDSTATMNLNGSQLQPGANNVTAVYSGDTDYTGSTSTPVTITLLTNQLSFNSVAVGATSPVQSVTYVFANDVTLSGIDILTAGVPGLDYGDGGSTTCVVGNPYIAGQSCTVSVAFTPSAASVRPGAVELFAQGSNLPLTTWYLAGIGSAPAVTIDPGTQSTLASIPNGAAQGSAIDGAGNLYVGDNANGQIIKVATTTFTQSTVATNLSQPTSVALDGAGNLYIAESNGVVMIPNENGTLNQTDMVTLNVSGLGTPQGVAIDSLGNVFITDVTSGNVIEVPANGGAQSTIASGLTNPHAVAVDSDGNVYVASDNQVAEYPAGGGTPALLGTGYNSPNGVTVDASGTVYVADTGNAQIVKVSAGGASQTGSQCRRYHGSSRGDRRFVRKCLCFRRQQPAGSKSNPGCRLKLRQYSERRNQPSANAVGIERRHAGVDRKQSHPLQQLPAAGFRWHRLLRHFTGSFGCELRNCRGVCSQPGGYNKRHRNPQRQCAE